MIWHRFHPVRNGSYRFIASYKSKGGEVWSLWGFVKGDYKDIEEAKESLSNTLIGLMMNGEWHKDKKGYDYIHIPMVFTIWRRRIAGRPLLKL